MQKRLSILYEESEFACLDVASLISARRSASGMQLIREGISFFSLLRYVHKETQAGEFCQWNRGRCKVHRGSSPPPFLVSHVLALLVRCMCTHTRAVQGILLDDGHAYAPATHPF